MANDTNKQPRTKKELVNELKCMNQVIDYFYELVKTYAQVLTLIAEHYNPDDKDGFLKPFFDKLEEQQKQNKNQGEN